MTEYFSKIPEIKFEGEESTNPFAFKFYDENKKVLGKSMKEHLRFATCYWHTFTWPGLDPFGGQTFDRPWMQACLLYTSPSPRDISGSRMPSSA